MNRIALVLILSFTFCNSAHALFVDQLTNREKPVADSVELLNSQMVSLIAHALDAANNSDYKCYERHVVNSNKSRDYLFAALQRGLLDFQIDNFAETSKQVSKKQTLFKDSIFSGVYATPSIWNMSGKVTDTEEVINVDGHQIATKKLARFLIDGFQLYKKQMATHLQGIEQTEKQAFMQVEKHSGGIGVVSYADYSATMAGYRFWVDLCGPSITEERCLPGKLLTCNETSGKWEMSKLFRFDFGNYVDDSWDEGINCSMFAADISLAITKNAQKVTKNKHLPCPVDPDKCFDLKSSASKKYLSPICTDVADKVKKGLTPGIFADYTYKPNQKIQMRDSEGKK